MPEHYLGIDVGHSQTKPTTGLCLITLEHSQLRWHCLNTGSQKAQRLADLMSLIPEGATISAVGIDGPLTKGFQLINRYRAADAFLSGGASFQSRCKPGPTNSPTGQLLHCHATKLAKLVLELNEESYLRVEDAGHPKRIHQLRVVEAFPNAFLGVLFSDALFKKLGRIPRGEKFDRFWETAVHEGILMRLIQHLDDQIRLDKPLGSITDHEHRAAFICALTGLCVARNKYVSVGDPKDGNICLPPFDVWGAGPEGADRERPNRWGETTLQDNRASLTRHQNLAKYPHHGKAVVFSNGECWH